SGISDIGEFLGAGTASVQMGVDTGDKGLLMGTSAGSVKRTPKAPTPIGESRKGGAVRKAGGTAIITLSDEERHAKLVDLEERMMAAAEELRFEEAAKLRDEIRKLHAAGV
ncbi:MAG: hypothetical protein JWN72_2778, partial [Thermoleophilia bacterium]|nr:hypothetical protein [Thermoleophilia bacterium]